MKYPKREDPYVTEIDPRKVILKIACCDCGLVHWVDINPVKGKRTIEIAFKRDQRATGQLRRHGYGH